MNNEDFLEHFGIPGMHWGRRKGIGNKSKPIKDKAHILGLVDKFLKELGNEIVNDDLFVAKVRYTALQRRGDKEGARKHLVKTVIDKALK